MREHKIREVVYCVRSTTDEQFFLWQMHSVDSPYSHAFGSRPVEWQSVSVTTRLVEVGKLNKRPICFEYDIVLIDGLPVMFYSASSVLVDWDAIKSWMATNVPIYATYRQHCGARSFAHCLHFLSCYDPLSRLGRVGKEDE